MILTLVSIIHCCVLSYNSLMEIVRFGPCQSSLMLSSISCHSFSCLKSISCHWSQWFWSQSVVVTHSHFWSQSAVTHSEVFSILRLKLITGETCDKPGAWLDSALRFLDASLKSFMKGNVQQASYRMMKKIMMLTANLGCLSLLFVSAKFDGIIVIHSYLIKCKCLFSSCSGRELDLLSAMHTKQSEKK